MDIMGTPFHLIATILRTALVAIVCMTASSRFIPSMGFGIFLHGIP